MLICPGILICQGNYSFCRLASKPATEAKIMGKQQKEIAALEDFNRTSPGFNTKRAQSRRNNWYRSVWTSRKLARNQLHDLSSLKTSGNIVLTAENAAIGHDGKYCLFINPDFRKMTPRLSLVPMVSENQPYQIVEDSFIKVKRPIANVEVGYDQTQQAGHQVILY